MSALVRGGTVLPHVQKFADDVMAAIPAANSFGTYPGHEPVEDQAVDCFVPVYSLEPGTSIANYAIANMAKYGIWYVIFRQLIWNPEIELAWRPMEDRGSSTQNHFDHVHLSFYATAPDPKPKPIPKPNLIKMEDSLFIYDGPQGVGGIWYTDMYEKWGVQNEDCLLPYQKGFVQHLGTVSKAFHYALKLRTDGVTDTPGVG